MSIVLLSNRASAIIHLLYVLRTKGIKVDYVIVMTNNPNKFEMLTEYSEANNFQVYFVSDANSSECQKILKKIAPDIIISMICQILKDFIFTIPRLGTINIHAGFLPKFRGTDCRRWAILKGGDVGVSIHFIDSGVDTGDIIVRKKIKIIPGDTIGDVAERSYYEGRYLALTEAIKRIKNNTVRRIKQKPSDGKQHFRMHPKLCKIVDQILKNNE